MFDIDASPYTSEIDEILTPAHATLSALLEDPESVDHKLAPVLAHMKEVEKITKVRERMKEEIEAVGCAGDLSVADRAMASNWFKNKIPAAKTAPLPRWMCGPPIAHTFTVLLAARHKDEYESHPEYPCDGTRQQQLEFILSKAYEYQRIASRPDLMHVDVDLWSLHDLEIMMFSVPSPAHPADYDQWGLDAGDHQEKWNPYGTQTQRGWFKGDDEFHKKIDVCFFCTHVSLFTSH